MGEAMIRSIACPIRRMAADDPSRIALCDDIRDVTYAQLDRMIDAAVIRFTAHGISYGDVVAILAKNSIACVIAFFAAWRMGFIFMPLNRRLSPQELCDQITAAGCKLLLWDDEHRTYIDQCKISSVSLEEISVEPDLPLSSRTAGEYALDRDAVIIFTSGTTDTPRGVVLTWSNFYHSARGAASVLPYRPDDVWLAALPFFHVGGISIPFRTALAGCAAYFMDRFDATRAIGAIAQRRISYISVVSTMLADMIRADHNHALERCRAIILGGGAWDESLVEEITTRRLPILTTYGLTETASMVTLLPFDSPPERLSTSGKALPYCEIKIISGDGGECRPGETGRIVVRGEVVFARYLNQISRPDARKDRFVTGDIGYIDGDAYLTVIGRADSVIISGGENIDLNRIEREMLRLPGVTGAVVMAVSDKRWGSRPIAFVEASETGGDESSLKAKLAERLSKIMIPDRIIVLDSLPRTGIGKYDRGALRRGHPDLFEENS